MRTLHVNPVLKAHNVDISMDCKGRWMDNVYVERLWRSLKYEEVYVSAYESVSEARKSDRRLLPVLQRRAETQLAWKTDPGNRIL